MQIIILCMVIPIPFNSSRKVSLATDGTSLYPYTVMLYTVPVDSPDSIMRVYVLDTSLVSSLYTTI